MTDGVKESVVGHHVRLNVWIGVRVGAWNRGFGNDGIDSSTWFSWSCWDHVVDCRLYVDMD